MKKFQFSLERVLNVRRIREKQRQREMAATVQAWEKEKQLLHRMESTETNSLEIIGKLQSRETCPAVVALAHNALEGQRRRRLRQETKVKMAGNRVESSRVALVKAMRSKRILEKLEEHRYEEFLIEVDKREQKNLDEIAGIKAELINKNE
jgi:flagellar FliJ protein